MTRTLAAVLIVLALPAAAAAQTPEWTEKIRMGKWVYVTTQTGDRIDGVAGQITRDGLVLATPNGIRTVPYGDVWRVQKRDSTVNGAVIGAAAGIAIGIVAALASDCSGRQCRAEEGGLVMAGALYGGISGWIADGQRDGKTTLFDAGTKVKVSPRRGGMTALVAISW